MDYPQYVSASWLARELEMSPQYISKVGRKALSEDYGGDFIRPAAVLDDGTPIWDKRKAMEFICIRRDGAT